MYDTLPREEYGGILSKMRKEGQTAKKLGYHQGQGHAGEGSPKMTLYSVRNPQP